jgi:hypothetical protein
MRFHFVSLKIGRLLLPYLLAVVFLSACLLREWWRWWAITPQIVFWALALIDPLFPAGSLFKKVTAMPRAFAVLVFSAVCALKIFFVPARRLWVEARSTPANSG